METIQEQNTSEVTIYKDTEGPAVEVSFEGDTVWLSQAQMALLFQKDVKTVSEHISNVYREKELEPEKTLLKKANSGFSGIASNKRIFYYNLDVIISVGYRVKSKRGTQFRIWATQRLRDYLLKGFVVNQERLKEQSQAKLKELEGAVKLLQRAMAARKTIGLEKELLSVITEYASTWATLVDFDEEGFPKQQVGKRAITLEYEDMAHMVSQFSERLGKSYGIDDGFGQERSSQFKKILEHVNKQVGSVADVGALLFYSVITEQPFIAGNKQIASLVLLVYLVHNSLFYNRKGERKLDDSTMIALAVLVEESSPQDKTIMLQLIASMINQK